MSCIVHFRFYEELNFFLNEKKQKREFIVSFNGNPSVKDAIESLGVPHTEVDLILANGRSVDFKYRLSDNDRISVYPVFESMDISGLQHLRDKPLREPCFIPDVHLGKLARYIRMAGFDCIYDRYYTDEEIIRISLLENRIILTRDKGILKNGKVSRGIYIRTDDPRQQFREIIRRLQLGPQFKPFSRCIECNGIIVKADKHNLLDQLQPLTRENFTDFRQCSVCKRIYWEGSHFDRMKAFIREIHPEL